jgi:hypothetical protein
LKDEGLPGKLGKAAAGEHSLEGYRFHRGFPAGLCKTRPAGCETAKNNSAIEPHRRRIIAA